MVMTPGFLTYVMGAAVLFHMSSALASARAFAAPLERLSYRDFLAGVDKNSEAALEQESILTLETEAKKAGVFPDPFVQVGRERQELPFVNPMEAEPKAAPPAWVLGLTQEFPWPGKLQSQRQARAAGVGLLKAQVDLGRLQRKLAAAEYYLDIIKSMKIVGVKKDSLSELEQALVIQTERRRLGLGSHSDLFATQTEVELLRSEVIALQQDIASRGARAALLAGLPIHAAVAFDEEFPKELLAQKKLEVAGADSSSDALNSVTEAQLGKRRAALEAERKDSLPSVTASLAFMRDDSEMLMFNAMLGLRLPLFSGAVRDTLDEVGARSAAATAKERAWNGQRNELAFFQCDLRVNQARANLRTLEERLVPLAADHARLLLSEFAQGKSSLAELNQARRTVLKLRQSRIEMETALAREGLAYEKITSGLGDETLDTPMPTLSAFAMEGGASMAAQAEMSSGGMKRSPKMQGSPGLKKQPEVREPKEPEDGGGQSSGSGMGM